MDILKTILMSLLINFIITMCMIAADSVGTNAQNWIALAEPTNAKGYFTQGEHYSKNGEWDKAITNFTEAILFDPTNTLAYGCRGWCYCKKGDFAKAINDFGLQIQLDPTNALAYCDRGNVYGITHEFDKAMIDLNECLRLTHWKRSDWIDTLAAAYAEAGNFEEAIKYQKQAMNMKEVTENDFKDMQRHLSLYEQNRPDHEGQKW